MDLGLIQEKEGETLADELVSFQNMLCDLGLDGGQRFKRSVQLSSQCTWQITTDLKSHQL